MPDRWQPGRCSSLFANAGNAQGVTVATFIGNVNFTGGVLLDGATYLPADPTALYATAGANFLLTPASMLLSGPRSWRSVWCGG